MCLRNTPIAAGGHPTVTICTATYGLCSVVKGVWRCVSSSVCPCPTLADYGDSTSHALRREVAVIVVCQRMFLFHVEKGGEALCRSRSSAN
jgi:hypothetical protein